MPVAYMYCTYVFAGVILLVLVAAATLPLYIRYRRRKLHERSFDVFVSYRVSSDVALVEKLYHLLTERGLRVWWVKKNLLWGQRWLLKVRIKLLLLLRRRLVLLLRWLLLRARRPTTWLRSGHCARDATAVSEPEVSEPH